jgi:hypothetical protein
MTWMDLPLNYQNIHSSTWLKLNYRSINHVLCERVLTGAISNTIKYVASGVYKRSSSPSMQAKTDKRNLNHLLIQVILSVVHCASELVDRKWNSSTFRFLNRQQLVLLLPGCARLKHEKVTLFRYHTYTRHKPCQLIA